MEFLYIDESGDGGLIEGSSDYYVLAGLSFDDWHWKENYWKVFDFKRQITQKYGLKIEEFKGTDIFSHRGPFFHSLVHPKDLKWIYNKLINLICDELHSNIFAVFKSKEEFKNKNIQDINVKSKKLIKVFREEIWMEYLSVYEKYLIKKSIRNECSQTALIYCDKTPCKEKYIRNTVNLFSRKFDKQSKYISTGIVEDIIFRDSKMVYFIQLADIIAYSINRILKKESESGIFSIEVEIIEKLKDRIGVNNEEFEIS